MTGRLALLPRGYRELFSHRAYRLYFASSTLGSFASAVQFLAQGWLVLQLGAGGIALAAFIVVRLAVKSLLAIPAGLAADRLPRATIYAWMRVVSGVASIVAAGAMLTPWPLAVVLLSAGIAAAAHALDLPAHRALQGEVQPDHQLERGLSFGTGGFHAAALSAPIIAFPLTLRFGATLPLLISALVFFVACVPAFRLPAVRASRVVECARRDISTALRFVAATPVVLALLLATTLPSVVDKAVVIGLPSTAKGGDSGSFGLVLAAPEVGAISVGLFLGGVNWRFAPWIPIVSAGGYAAGIVTASYAGLAVGVELIAVALFLAGCAKTTLITSALAGIQRYVPAELRGRIMTI